MYSVSIIDDEPWVAITLMENVDWESLGFFISKVYSRPQEALREICRDHPDVVFVDISMPLLNGLELIEQACDDGCSSHFIVLTAYADFEYARKAIRLGVVDYCLKPINPSEIRQLLCRLAPVLEEEKKKPGESEFPENRFEEILHYIREHKEEKLSLQSISEFFFVNRNYICALFQKNLGTTFTQYLTSLRMDSAKNLLLHTDIPLSLIAEKSGFKDEFYFNKVFKKSEGISPGLYRRLHASQNREGGQR